MDGHSSAGRGGLTVLVTRPEPGATATATALAAEGHTPILSPCLRIETVPLSLRRLPDAIAITSSQALPALAAAADEAARGVPVFAVGDATAARARDAGFADVTSAAGTAKDLAALIAARMTPGSHVLLAVGARRSLDLARHLRGAGLVVIRRIAYRTDPAESLSGPALAALREGSIDRILLFSPASAASFARLIERAGLVTTLAGTVIVAISDAAAKPLATLRTLLPREETPWEIRTATHPDQDHMLAMME